MTPDPISEAKHSTGLHQQIAEWGLLFECVAGSKLLGVNVDDSDDDRLGVCIEPPEWTLGLRKFEQYVGRTKPMGERSKAGDSDAVIYSLRKFCSLAMGGNPTILQMLYVPEEYEIKRETSGYQEETTWFRDDFMGHAHLFASKKAGKCFLGYMQQQRQRLMGERGQKNVKRPELEEMYGYDTKYASHILRLGYQGIEYLQTGGLTLPMQQPERDKVLAVRRGEVVFNDMLSEAGELELEIKSLLDESPLPDEPFYDTVNSLLVDTYSAFYELKGWHFDG